MPGYVPLILNPIGISEWAQRGLIQTYEKHPFSYQEADTVNGEAINMAPPTFRKWITTITCTDMRAPPLHGIWGGQTLVLHCISPFNYKEGTPEGKYERPYRTDHPPWSEDGFRLYYPIMDVEVQTFTSSDNKWQASINWQLVLKELRVPTGPFV